VGSELAASAVSVTSNASVDHGEAFKACESGVTPIVSPKMQMVGLFEITAHLGELGFTPITRQGGSEKDLVATTVGLVNIRTLGPRKGPSK